uniref:aralkylamine N-acetyltransferase n=1 Tax=Parastrongyloides trichosuri TaxID=131310 RepID=A0A0N4Z3N4_PARTI
MSEEVKFTIRCANKEDRKDIVEFLLTDFLYNEALNASCGLTREEAEEFFGQLTDIGLEGEESCLIKNNENKIIGVRMACIMCRDDVTEEDPCIGKETLVEDGKIKVITKSSYTNIEHIKSLLSHVDSKLWSSLPERVNKIMNIIILSVSQDYTRRGYGGMLISFENDKLKSKNVDGILAECSAIKSQNLFAKHGYTCEYSICHKDFVDENNHQIFIAKDKTDSVKIMFKELI